MIESLTKNFSLKLLVFALVLVATFFGLYWLRPHQQVNQGVQLIDATNYSQAVKKNQEKVIVGIYPLTVSQIDTSSNTFQMSAYIWMIWSGDIKPNETFEIMNLVNRQQDYMKTDLEHEVLKDGRFYHLMKVEGTFFQAFDMTNYPVDQQQLTLILEDSVSSSEDLVYVPDVNNTKTDQLVLTGWELNQVAFKVSENAYESNFGYTDEVNQNKVSQLKFIITISHPFMFFFVKFVFPLTLILLANYIVYWLPYAFIESKLFFISGTLLSLMFLQQQYLGRIPNQQLVLIDYVYLFSYLATFLTMMGKIYFYKKITKGWDEQRADMWDKLIFTGQIVVYAVLVLGIYLKYLEN